MHAGDGGTAGFGHDGYRLVIQGIRLPVFIISPRGWRQTGHGFCRGLQNFRQVIRIKFSLEMPGDLVNLRIGDKGAMDAYRYRGTRRHIEHVTMTQQLFRSHLVKDGARINL